MIIGPALVVTGGPEPRVIEDGGVRVAGAHIAQVGPIGTLAAAYRDETVWPAGGRLLLPGLVDAHAHLARHLARGLDLQCLADWDGYDKALAPEDVRWAALAALAESVRHGITTTFDLHRSGSFLDFSLSEVADAARRIGVRVATAYAAHEEDGAAERRAAIEESLGLASELRRVRDGRVGALLGLRVRSARGLEELGTMVEETADRAALHVELAPRAAGSRWTPRHFSRATLWAHAERLAPARFAGNEEPALLVASPSTPLDPDADRAWGSDSGPHAPPVLAPRAVAAEAEMARLHYQRSLVTGARWAEHSFGEGLGMIEAGSPADLILVDYRPPTELDRESVFTHLGAALGRAAVSGVMVAGQIVMDHGVLVTIDEAEVAARARECARRIAPRRAGPVGPSRPEPAYR